MTSDDLAPLFESRESGVARYGQGKIIAWNPETFENRVLWNGLELENLPVLSGADSITFQPGQNVALRGWDPKGTKGSTVWWIDGRILIPGTGAAEETIGWMVSSLGQAVAREVISQTVHSDTVAPEESLTEPAGTSTSYEDLDTVGPSVTFETQTGRWLIILVAHAGVGPDTAGRMSYEATGAQSISADDARSSLMTDPADNGIQGSVTYANSHTGSPGEVTVTAKYRVIPPAADPPPNGVASWQNRTMIVIAY